MMKVKDALHRALMIGLTGGLLAACGDDDSKAQQAEQAHVAVGIAVAEADDPDRWAPSREAVEQMKRDAAAPPIRMADDGSSDIALGEMERPPVPPEQPRLPGADEADRYGLAAWEQMARGEVKVKRIRY